MFNISINKLVEFCADMEKNNTESAWYGSFRDDGEHCNASVRLGNTRIEYGSISDERGIFYEYVEICNPHYYKYNGGNRTWKFFECDKKRGDTNDVAEDFADFLAEEMIMNPSRIRREACHVIAVLFKAERD